MGKQFINRQVDPTVFDRLLEPCKKAVADAKVDLAKGMQILI